MKIKQTAIDGRERIEMAEGVEGQINLRGRGGGRLMKSIILIF
jgi:hypothetical protein